MMKDIDIGAVSLALGLLTTLFTVTYQGGIWMAGLRSESRRARRMERWQVRVERELAKHDIFIPLDYDDDEDEANSKRDNDND
jgi:hypothetical protein